MRRRELERKLRAYGWWFLRHGGRHDIWTNGVLDEAVPRHNEIAKATANNILKTARECPPQEWDIKRG